MPTACVIDGESFKARSAIQTSLGAHGLYPSRDGKQLYVVNRGRNGSTARPGRRRRDGDRLRDREGGGALGHARRRQPDMGNVSADGKYLWLAAALRRRGLPLDTSSGGSGRSRSAPSRTADGVAAAGARWGTGNLAGSHTGNLRQAAQAGRARRTRRGVLS